MLIYSSNNCYSFSDIEHALKLGGKFSDTFIAVRKSDNAKVILKRASLSVAKSDVALKRFYDEASLNTNSKILAACFECFEFEGKHYLVREYVEGNSWREVSKKVKLQTEHLQIAISCLQCIAELHQSNIIHRDIRPDNFILKKNGNEWQAVLIDLGLAKNLTDKSEKKVPFSLIYSPPEQIMNCNAAVDFTSDMYAFAVSLYEMLTQSVPFYNANPELMMHLQINTPLPENKKVPTPIFDLLKTATSKHKFMLPTNRYSKQQLIELFLAANNSRIASAKDFIKSIHEIPSL